MSEQDDLEAHNEERRQDAAPRTEAERDLEYYRQECDMLADYLRRNDPPESRDHEGSFIDAVKAIEARAEKAEKSLAAEMEIRNALIGHQSRIEADYKRLEGQYCEAVSALLKVRRALCGDIHNQDDIVEMAKMARGDK